MVVAVLMDLSVKDTNDHGNKKDMRSIDSVKGEELEDDEEDNERKALLPPRENGMSRSFEKGTRKVQWNDSIGNSLTEVLEFQPSEASDNEDEDSDSCVCVIM